MSTLLFRWLFLTILGALLSVFASAQAPANLKIKAKAKPVVTTIYLVRHAEKDTVGHAPDPALTSVGEARANALSQRLARRRPAALFTTDTRRTRATLAPLATATSLQPEVYDAKQPTALAVRISQEFAGKTVVVVGHSNTLLPLIKSLGGTAPVEEIGDDEYDYLFTVRLTEGSLPTVGVRAYGAKRKTESLKSAGRATKMK